MRLVEQAVPKDERPCPFCDQDLREEHPALAIVEGGVLRWAHPLCAIKISGRGVSGMIPGMRACA